MEIYELSEKTAYLKEAIHLFWKTWGNESNFKFYEDCIIHSLDSDKKLPKFYIGLKQDKIIATYALLTNDIISRQDLYPWFACLYVDPLQRKQGYAGQLLKHGLSEAQKKGYEQLYLSTDLVNFYERKGWTLYGKGYGVFGGNINIYAKTTF